MRRSSSPNWRFYFVVSGLFAIALMLFGRVIQLATFDKDFLRMQGNARSLRTVDIPAFRGTIVDRNGTILALSTPVFAIWVSPKELKITDHLLTVLSNTLSIDKSQLKRKIQRAKQRDFLYIKRGVSPAVKSLIVKERLEGVYMRQEFKRFYPHGEVTSHVLGFTNIDDKGIEGVELAFNEWLKGVNGRDKVIKDRLGQIIDKVSMVQPPKNGHELVLSIDKRIQYQAYQALTEVVQKFNAKSGSVVVLDVKSGEVLAMVNAPSFNPNKAVVSRDGSYRNRAMTDIFEPGSVMKAFSIASALDSGSYDKDSVVDTSPSWMVVDGNLIRDDKSNGILSMTEILKRSSNVGIAKLVLSSSSHQLVGLLRKFGFGQTTSTGFPGEASGEVKERRASRLFDLATLGFGYGMTASTLQLAKAYMVFANGGELTPVSLLKQREQPKTFSVIKPQTAADVLHMLEAVVESNGTGRHARTRGYRVAGKTGTSRLVGRHGYEKNRHIASFVGIAPVSSPRLVVAVVIREPRKISYYGGVVAAPLFSKIMQQALMTLGVKPDKVAT